MVFLIPLTVSSFAVLVCGHLAWRTFLPGVASPPPEPLQDLVRGLAYAGLTALLTIGFALTLIGIPVALLLATTAIEAAMAGMAVGLADVGEAVAQAFKLDKTQWSNLHPPLLGAAALFVLSLVPVMGWLAMVAYSLASFGRVVDSLRGELQRRRAQPAATIAATTPSEVYVAASI